ncbi:MAG: hypothetical protein WC749_09530 [Dehalococcoidia bacterium]
MEDFSLDDIIKKGKDASKSPKKKHKKGKENTMGDEILAALESYGEAMRDLHRPPTDEERTTIKMLVNETENCVPTTEDLFVIQKLIDTFEMFVDMATELPSPNIDDMGEEMPLGAFMEAKPGIMELVFGLGMAYERLKSKGSL